MALIYRKYQNKGTRSKSFGKWFGKLVNTGTLDTDALCRHIQEHGSIYTADVVKGVVEKFIQCFDHLLMDGHRIKLDGLGTFYLRIETKGAEAKDEFTPENFLSLGLGFRWDKSAKSEYSRACVTRAGQAATFIDVETLADPNLAPASGSGTSGNSGSSGSDNTGDSGDGDDPVENRP